MSYLLARVRYGYSAASFNANGAAMRNSLRAVGTTCLTLFVFLGAPHGYAQTWKKIGKTIVYDADSLRYEGSYVYVWLKDAIGGPTPRYRDGKLIRYDDLPHYDVTTLSKLNCTERTRQQHEVHLYQGGVEVNSDLTVRSILSIQPESDANELLRVVCKKKWEFWK